MTRRRGPLAPIFDPVKSRGQINTGVMVGEPPPTLTVTVTLASTQEDPYDGIPPGRFHEAGVAYDVEFSRPVTGFAFLEPQVGGTADPWYSSIGSSVNNPLFRVIVLALRQPGTVTLTIPAGVVEASDIPGLLNEESTAVGDVEVTFEPGLIPRGSLVVGANLIDSSFVNGHVIAALVDTAELVSIDISDPDNPAVADTLALGASPRGIAVSGTHAFVTVANGLRVVDVTDPTNMSVVGTLTHSTVTDRILYDSGFCYTLTNTTNVLRLINVSTPTSPTLAGAVDLGATVGGRGLAKVGDHVLASVDSGFYSIDVSSPFAPTVTGFASGGPAQGGRVIVIGSHAYVLNTVYDVSDPSSPSNEGLWGAFSGGTASALGAYGSELVQLATTSAGGVGSYNILTLFDVSNPTSGAYSRVGSVRTPPLTGLVVVHSQGDFIYITHSVTAGLSVWEVLS